MLTPLVLLVLSLTPAALSPGTPAPDSAVLLPPEVKEVPRWKGVSPAVNVLLLEALLAGYSALAAESPEATGWVAVGLSPACFMNLQPGDTVEAASVMAIGTAGIGLYDALELRGRGYSWSGRFWRNMAAWNVVAAGTQIAALLTRSDEVRPRGPSLALGLGASTAGHTLLLKGRF